MATNFVKHGDEFDYPNGSGTGIKSGDVVIIGDVAGIALTDILDGSTGTVQVAGVAIMPKTTGTAWTQGKKLYWNPSTSKVTTAADDGGSPAVAFVFVGWAYVAALSADATGQVKLKIS